MLMIKWAALLCVYIYIVNFREILLDTGTLEIFIFFNSQNSSEIHYSL